VGLVARAEEDLEDDDDNAEDDDDDPAALGSNTLRLEISAEFASLALESLFDDNDDEYFLDCDEDDAIEGLNCTSCNMGVDGWPVVVILTGSSPSSTACT
jgi:hypothetical protein